MAILIGAGGVVVEATNYAPAHDFIVPAFVVTGALLGAARSDDKKATVAFVTHRLCAHVSEGFDALWEDLEAGRLSAEDAAMASRDLRSRLTRITDMTSELKEDDEKANAKATDAEYAYLEGLHAQRS